MKLTLEQYSRRFPDRPHPVPAKYLGQWIAWNVDRTVIISHGENLDQVANQAVAAGCEQPILQKIPSGIFIGGV